MEKNADYKRARDILMDIVTAVERIQIPLEDSTGMVLAQALRARENVPSFDRSPYDGYALRAADSRGASVEHPIVLQVTEEIAAGAVPKKRVEKGMAAKVMTGAPIPEGADAVIMYEKTEFTETSVALTEEMHSGDNIVYAGEDMKKGEVLAAPGTVIDPGLAGTLAAQGVFYPRVYRNPRIGVIVTGNEIVDAQEAVPDGRIRNTNRYLLSSELEKMGCVSVYYGIAEDSADEIAKLVRKSLCECDAVLLTGGVSAGKYDLTPAAMEKAGVNLLVKNVNMKPGMACAYGEKDGKLVCGLSGNPASCITNFYAVVMPALRKLSGRKDCLPKESLVTLADDFGKKSRITRILRGRADLSDGTVKMRLSPSQGNAVISSSIGCDILAVVPAGSGCLGAGTTLKGFLIGDRI